MAVIFSQYSFLSGLYPVVKHSHNITACLLLLHDSSFERQIFLCVIIVILFFRGWWRRRGAGCFRERTGFKRLGTEEIIIFLLGFNRLPHWCLSSALYENALRKLDQLTWGNSP